MKIIINILIVLLIIVASSQVFTLFVDGYSLVDELLIFILFGFYLVDKFKRNRFNIRWILLLSVLFSFVLFSFILNYFSVISFIAEIIFYAKILIIAVVLKSFASLLHERTKAFIFIFLLLISIAGIIEFFYVQFVSNSFLQEMLFLKYRDGIYRATSITGHPINLGMLSFISFVYIIEFRKRIIYAFVFFMAILASGSRLPLFFVVLYLLFRVINVKIINIKIKYLYILLVPFLLFTVMFYLQQDKEIRNKEKESIRLISSEFTIKVLVSNPCFLLFGSSVGTYGNKNSFLEKTSPIYYKYNYPLGYMKIINSASGAESFFFIAILELGLIGSLLYYFLFFNTFKSLRLKYFFFFLNLIYSVIYPLYTIPYLFLLFVFFVNESSMKNDVLKE